MLQEHNLCVCAMQQYGWAGVEPLLADLHQQQSSSDLTLSAQGSSDKHSLGDDSEVAS